MIKKPFYKKPVAWAFFIILATMILVSVAAMMGRKVKEAAFPATDAGRRQESKQPSIRQVKYGAIGCTDKMFVVDASRIQQGLVSVSKDYVEDLWQRGGCRPVGPTLGLVLIGQETVSSTEGPYRMVKVWIATPAGRWLQYLQYLYDEPIYVMVDDLRTLNAHEKDRSASALR